MAASKAGNRKSKSSGSDPLDDIAAAALWQRAVRLLAAHDRSEQEVRTRLSATTDAPNSLIDQIVRRLQDRRYLDDGRLALHAAEHAVLRGHGSEYVRATLGAKGVAEAFIESAIGATFIDETALARRVLARRYPIAPQRPAERAKAARFLAQRGFPETVVLAILGEGC